MVLILVSFRPHLVPVKSILVLFCSDVSLNSQRVTRKKTKEPVVPYPPAQSPPLLLHKKMTTFLCIFLHVSADRCYSEKICVFPLWTQREDLSEEVRPGHRSWPAEESFQRLSIVLQSPLALQLSLFCGPGSHKHRARRLQVLTCK